VPVRGEVLGPECLAEVIGRDTSAPHAVPTRPRAVSFDVVGIMFLATVAATVLPWTRFGVASGLFGAWGLVQARWSTLAAGAAVRGLILWIRLRVSRRIESRGLIALFVLALASIAGAVLHCYNPPPFTHAWIGPWAAIPLAALTACATLWTLRAVSRTEQPPEGVP